MLEKLKSQVRESVKRLDKWLEDYGWSGYDPYDIKGKPIYSKSMGGRSIISKATRRFMVWGTDRHPLFMRKFFRIKKAFNSKAIGLFARGYLALFRSEGDVVFREKALKALQWLQGHPSQGYSHLCFGYPFDWDSRIFIPAGTPSAVVTAICAHAFMDAFQETGDEKYLKNAESCCEFIINGLNIDHLDKNQVCFSYTPIDNFHIHNANLFCASILLRVNKFVTNHEYKALAVKAINFTVNNQNEDGSWYYWAPPDELKKVIDNYHTGFVLECLNLCKEFLGDEFIAEPEFRKGVAFYFKHFIGENGEAKWRQNETYPIDIHSCAETIICLATLSPLFLKAIPLLAKTLLWTFGNMQDEKGFFYYRKYETKTDRMPYIRWGQAWMLWALSRTLIEEEQ